jgi:hypothetical protein
MTIRDFSAAAKAAMPMLLAALSEVKAQSGSPANTAQAIFVAAGKLVDVVEEEDFIDGLEPVPRAMYEVIDCALEWRHGSSPELDAEMLLIVLTDALATTPTN